MVPPYYNSSRSSRGQKSQESKYNDSPIRWGRVALLLGALGISMAYDRCPFEYHTSQNPPSQLETTIQDTYK